MRRRLVCLAALALLASSSDALAQRSIDQRLTVESFTGFAGAGFAPAPGAGQLGSDDWRTTGMSDGDCAFGATCASGDHAQGPSPGNESQGGFYAFSVPEGGPALGFQASSNDMTPGTITHRLTNDTGATITDVSFEYTFWFYNNESSSQSLSFAFSTDDVSYTSVAALSDTTPTTATGNAWTSRRLTADLTGLNIASGATLYLRWSTDDASGSGGRDEVAIDEITVRIPGCGDAVVEGGEVCDDGDETDGQGCLDDCSGTAPGFECVTTTTSVCTDIDECDLGTDTCMANSTCDNLPGSFQCPCDAGYQGDGLTGCSDIDECDLGTDTCDSNATCSNTVGDYDCACDAGWEGDGQTCADIDECDLGTDDCGAGNLCTNTPGSFDCACENGFDWNGTTCIDIDECAEGIAGCDEHALCDNFAGGFNCECQVGWEGDGLSCTASDGDGDGIAFDQDNCPGDANPGQEDSDGDGRGDVCDFVDDNAGDEDSGGCGCRATSPGSLLSSLFLLALALIPLRRRRR